ncbi:MAG: MipA/OmpV family protein [Planctomycetaceae bacterium]|nr:MipA/OmpV family protein [Planctomycetaceae bacterium]
MLHHLASLILLSAVPSFSTEAVPRDGSARIESVPLADAWIGASPTASQAESNGPLFPLPFTPDFTRGGGWGFALGLGVEYENAYSGSDEYEFEVDPAVSIQWRTGNHLFSWEGLELSWTTRQMDRWYFQVDLGLDGEREEGDSDDGNLDGLEERDDEFAATGEVRYFFDSEWRNYIGTRISVGNSDFGTLGFLFAGHRFGARQDGGGTEVFLYSTFADSSNLNRDFGINSSEAAASGLAATDLDGGYRSSGLRVVDRRFLGKHFQIVSGFEVQLFGSDVQDSPIAREDFSVEVELGVLYHF